MTMPWNHSGEQPKIYKTLYHYALCMVGLHFWRGSRYEPVGDKYHKGYCYRCGYQSATDEMPKRAEECEGHGTPAVYCLGRCFKKES